MSFIGGGFGVASGPASGLRFAQTRGRLNGSPVQGVNYPSPFFDIAHTYLPVTVKQLFRWCRYYFLTNPLINATVFKLAEYPITDIIIDHPNPQVVKDWTEYFQDHLRFRAFQAECGLDYFCYGNAPITVSYPLVKYLHCRSCGFSEHASKIRPHWSFTNYEFRLHCPKCGTIDTATPRDQYLKNASGIRLVRWNPEDIEISYNDISGEYTYFYTIPSTIRSDVVLGKKDIVEGVPQVFIQALKEQKGIIFNKDNFFHMKRPTLATQDRGWGIPLLLPVLKDTFYLQLMKKAQEAILIEHIVPLRVLFPQAGSASSDPYSTINLSEWKDHVSAEIARWRYDNNYIPIFPLPIGQETIGGDGRALLLTGEIQQWSEQIINGMQVPVEFIKGGLSYAGTNVSMRMLENQFVGYLLGHKNMAKFVMKQIAAYMEWPEVGIRFKPFKMADDIQRKAFLFQLAEAGKISDTTLLADSDLAQDEEYEAMMRESDQKIQAQEKQQLAMAELQGKQQVIMTKQQAKAQEAMAQAQMQGQAPGEPGGGPGGMGGVPGGVQSPLAGNQQMGGGGDIMGMAQMYAQQLVQLPPDQQQQTLQSMPSELAGLVQQMVAQMGGQAGGQPAAQGPQVDMRPMPEQRPGIRAGGNMV